MYTINKYPDGSSYVNGTSCKSVTFRINTYDDLWHLNQYVDAFISERRIQPNIVIPNLLDAQADRRFKVGDTFGLKLVLKFLKSLPVNHYYIFHPHNQEVVEMYLDNVTILDNTDFIKTALGSIYNPSLDFNDKKEHLEENLILMAADAGGFKPLSKLCDKLQWQGDTESCSKSRKGGVVGEQRIPMNDFGGKDIMIIDDIAVYGGTFKGLSTLLRKANIGKLYLAVSHITIQNHKPNPKNPDDKVVFEYFDKVFTTNSKFDDYFTPDNQDHPIQPDNLKVINLFNTK